MTYFTRTQTETEQLGERTAMALPAGGVVMALYGELGAGKTAFVRGLARGLGVEDEVVSPTFTIVNEYSGGGKELLHFDMYRLGGAQELLDIGWDDYLARDAVIAVEWSENVEEIFDGSEVTVRIEKRSDSEREITIEGGGEAC